MNRRGAVVAPAASWSAPTGEPRRFSSPSETPQPQRGNGWCASDLRTPSLLHTFAQKRFSTCNRDPPRTETPQVRRYSNQDGPDQLLADPGVVDPHPWVQGWLSAPHPLHLAEIRAGSVRPHSRAPLLGPEGLHQQ